MLNNLEVTSLNVGYKNSDFLVENVSFSIPKGKILGMVGENGAGKTTIFNTILGLKLKKSGEVKIFGQKMDENRTSILEKIGVVFDDIYLPEQLTAKEISHIYMKIYQQWDLDFFEKTLKRFEIPLDKKVKNYSKGMQKTLSIILGMAHHPKLLLLGEPTASLDPVKRHEILELFQEFIEDGEKSILFSSHITNDLERIADYVVFIKNGKKILDAEVTDIIYKYGIVRCTTQELGRIPKEIIVSYQKKAYNNVVLVNDRTELSDKLVIENPTFEEIMNMFVKGKRI